jgi:hypothetical protein
MSYQIQLFSNSLNPSSFQEYFQNRDNYEDSGKYFNQNTQVDFIFELILDADIDDEETSPHLRKTHVVFTLNYVRPHVFAVEAEIELTAFVNYFQCSVEDYQIDGMKDGKYSNEAFLKAWNVGNSFGISALEEMGESEIYHSERQLVESVWRWNFEIEHLTNSLKQDRYVPSARWGRLISDGSLVTFCIWGEGVRSVLPEFVSHVLLVREKPKGLLGLFSASGPKFESHLLPISEILSIEGVSWKDFEGQTLLFAPLSIPPSKKVLDLFKRSFTGMESLLSQLRADEVLTKAE